MNETKTERKWYDQYEVKPPTRWERIKYRLSSSDFWNVVGIVATILGLVLWIVLH